MRSFKIFFLACSILQLVYFEGCKSSPTEKDDTKYYSYYEGIQIPNTEIFVSMDKYDGIAARPVVSPDGNYMIFYKNYTSRDSFGLYIKTISTGTERLLVKDGYHPDWSPDGEWIAFNIEKHIYKIRKNGEDLTRLTFSTMYSGYSGSEYDVDWSPDNLFIAFSYAIDYRSNLLSGIYKLKIDSQLVGENAKQYLFNAGDPDWHPNRTNIIGIHGYSSSSIWNRFPIYNIQLNQVDYILDGTLNEDNGNPHYSPDGKRVVYINDKGIWIMNSDGSAVKRILPNDLSADRFPDYKGGIKLMVGSASWYPDGQSLIYTNFKVTRYTVIKQPTTGPNVNVEGFMSFYKVNVDSAISISNLP